VNLELPDGVDEEEYQRIRKLMRASVLGVWRSRYEVIGGTDPWDVVDEAWSSMAAQNFQAAGPFMPFALRVAQNKAIDTLRRAEVRRGYRSIDAPLDAGEGTVSLVDVMADSEGADADYFRESDRIDATRKLSLVEDAIYEVLTPVERRVFLAVRVDGKSGAAVGRELDPPVTGQRVGQIVARAFVKIQAYLSESPTNEGGEADGRR
jgi:DNA-directed RNA polymerase specialized sigma24 family protein